MSSMMQCRKLSVTKRVKDGSEINKRDMSMKKRVIPKVAKHCADGKAEVTAVWNFKFGGQENRISFSRDNLGVWVNGQGIPIKEGFITDHGYDVDLFFEALGVAGHIYSDVEGNQMMNYLVLGQDLVGVDFKDFNHLAQQ